MKAKRNHICCMNGINGECMTCGKSEPTKDEIAPKGCIDMEILKVLGKDKLEALMWYVPNELKADFVSCLNHSLKPFIEKEPSPSESAAIAEFMEDYAKVQGFDSAAELRLNITKKHYHEIEQAARNLLKLGISQGEKNIIDLVESHVKDNKFEHYDCFVCTIARRIKQETEQLKQQLSEKDTEIAMLKKMDEVYKKHATELLEKKQKELINLAEMTKNLIEQKNTELSQFREGVGKLKRTIGIMCGTDNIDFNRYWKAIDKIFPSCAEQPKDK